MKVRRVLSWSGCEHPVHVEWIKCPKCALEAKDKEIKRLTAIEAAARMFVMHTPVGHIGGMVERNYYNALEAALKEQE